MIKKIYISVLIIFVLVFPNFAEKGIIIDSFENVKEWKSIGSEEVYVNVKKYRKGISGKAICLEFDMIDENEWALMSKDVALILPEDFEISFYVKGKTPVVNLEFKMIDKDDNTFIKKFIEIEPAKKWEKIVLKKEDIKFGWGPDEKAKLKHIKKIQLGVSFAEEGYGKIYFDELVLTPLSGEIGFALKASASTEEKEEFKAANAIDGNLETRWASIFSDNQWLEIDMGQEKRVSGLDIHWEAAYTKEYNILVSTDKKDWKTVYSTTSGNGEKDSITFPSENARYIKIDCIKRGSEWGNSIYEVEIKYNEPARQEKNAGTQTFNIGSKTVTVSSTENPENTPDKVIDGDMNTRWGSNFNDNEWIQIDYGKKQKAGRITIYWEAAFSREYEVFISEEGSQWKSVYSTDNGDGGRDDIDIKPSKTFRYLKIDLKKRGTEWGNSIFEIKLNDYPPKKASASSGEGVYAPIGAVDGDFKTRWSSDFKDDQWWEVEFEKPRYLCGMTIHWETAYGEIYKIAGQLENGKWQYLFSTTNGDGQRDIIYFKPVTVKKIKIYCEQRGTGWGFSIWEIDFYDGNKPHTLNATSSQENNSADLAMDGDTSTEWRSSNEKEAELTVKLPQTWELGGLLLQWGEDYPADYSVELSNNGSDWSRVYQTNEGDGKTDWIFFSPAKANMIRFNCKNSVSGNGYSISEIELKGGEEKATPLKIFQAAAKISKLGLYPIWLRRLQGFWTVIGDDNDDQESLISEMGTIEPYFSSFTVMPIIIDDGKIVTWNDCEVTQRLEDEYLPIPTVTWDHKDWSLDITAFTTGSQKTSNSIVRYRFKNKSSKQFKGKLVLGIYPVQLNPIWQGGGFSSINNIKFNKNSEYTSVDINGSRRIVSVTTPEKMGGIDIKNGDIVKYVLKQNIPSRREVKDDGGLASGGLMYDLEVAPQTVKDVINCYPLWVESGIPSEYLSNSETYFKDILESVKDKWHKIIDRFEINIPEKRLVNFMKSNIAYILINKDDPWLKPGSRRYAHSWIRDGAITCVTLLRTGHIEPVRRWIEAVTPHVHESGAVPHIFFSGGTPIEFNYNDWSGMHKELDAQGEYIYAIRQYIDYTGDKAILNKLYDKAIKAAKYIGKLREMTKTGILKRPEPEYYGLLPPSESHEGYCNDPSYSHWDNFWGIRGLKDAIHISKLIGETENVVWLEKELKDFRKCIYESMLKVIKRDNIDYLPASANKGDRDPTSTAIAIMAGGEYENLPQPYLENTYNAYYDEFYKGIEKGRQFTPYEVRIAEAFIRMGQRERAITMLRHFSTDSSRPRGFNHLAEVVYPKYRFASYVGDMPHTWVGAGFINTVRAIFVYEKDDKLIVGAGIVPEWFEKGVHVKGLPTIYGKINIDIEKKGTDIIFEVTGDIHPPSNFEVPLPEELKKLTVEQLVGHAEKNSDGVIKFKSLPVKLRIY